MGSGRGGTQGDAVSPPPTSQGGDQDGDTGAGDASLPVGRESCPDYSLL